MLAKQQPGSPWHVSLIYTNVGYLTDKNWTDKETAYVTTNVQRTNQTAAITTLGDVLLDGMPDSCWAANQAGLDAFKGNTM